MSMKIVKLIKNMQIAVVVGIALWSILIDIFTYNVIFPTDKNIILYCIDGLVFNFPKMIIPMIIYVSLFIIEKLMERYAYRSNRYRQSQFSQYSSNEN